MSSRTTLLLAAVGAAVVIALVMLLVKVTRQPEVAIDEDKLAQARAMHEQLERDSARAAPSVPRRSASDWRGRYEPGEAPPEAVDPGAERAAPPSTVRVDPPPQIRAPGRVGDLVQAKLGDGPLEQRLDGANALYDRADYEGAREAAMEILRESPDNVRMLRIVVSASCIMGDHDLAGQHFDRLARPRDRRQMSIRCSRYGVELTP